MSNIPLFCRSTDKLWAVTSEPDWWCWNQILEHFSCSLISFKNNPFSCFSGTIIILSAHWLWCVWESEMKHWWQQVVGTYRNPQSLWGGSSGWVWWVLKGQSEVIEGGWQWGRGLRGCLRRSPLLLSPSPSTESPSKEMKQDATKIHKMLSTEMWKKQNNSNIQQHMRATRTQGIIKLRIKWGFKEESFTRIKPIS